MHVHSLAFAAVGPFAGEHRIDFDELGGAALLIIDGPTGAGKSTIIDALVFALYGDVAGRSSDRQRLRSAFATDDDDTYAEVEFSTSFGRYRVRRTPEYERAKKRGTGTTSVPSSVTLMRSTGGRGWEPVSSLKGEADAEIQRAIGLTRAQFLQTVVLPQGEFAAFLAAESKERQAVLERIFATDLYSRIEAALDDRRVEAQRRCDAADRAVSAAVQHVISRLSDEDMGDLVVDPTELADPESALAIVAQIQSAAAVRLVSDQACVEATSADLRSARTRLRDAEDRTAARAAVAAAQEAVVQAEAELVASVKELDAYAPLIAELVDGDDEIVAEIDRLTGALGQVLAIEKALPTDRRRLAEIAEAIDRVDIELAALVVEREKGLPDRLLSLSMALEQAARVEQDRLEAAQLVETGLVRRRLDGMAAELAEGLHDESPCPVCGALEHPQPAARDVDAVAAGDIEAATADRVEAESARHAWDLASERLRTVAGGIDLPASAPTEARAVGDITQGIRRFQQDVDRIESASAAGRERRATMSAAHDALALTIAEREHMVDEQRRGRGSVAERRREMIAARGVVQARDHAQTLVVAAQSGLADAVRAQSRWAADEPAPDVPALAEHCRQLDVRLQATTSARDATARLVEDLRVRVDLASAAVTSLHDVRTATRDVIALASIVRGSEGNALAQPLSAYVVQAMFDEILEAANTRLQAMLDGRFVLRSTEQRTGSARLGQGLGLEVVDQRTDTIRRTATLSGGETFCASLALALGLADTVRSHVGGVELGMLFIDEGFGSLDGDRLDEVMAELLRLRADGRTVAVISHVSEMKKSISERIDVIPLGGRQGSTLSVSWSA